MELDFIDRRLLEIMQKGFPLVPEPFAELGRALGISPAEALHRVKAIKARGIIREIDAIFNSRALGYQSTLLAMRLPPQRLGEAAGIIGQHPGISHSYAREHAFNLWLTLALPPQGDLEREARELAARAGAETLLSLPAVRIFKIAAFFRLTEQGYAPAEPGRPGGNTPGKIELSARERAVGRVMEVDVPLIERPFEPMARRLAISQEELLGLARRFLERGLMRRYAARLQHRKLGFTANAMGCWRVPQARIEEAGQLMASSPSVTHCYERATDTLWPYNLFAMIHALTRRECRDLAQGLSRRIGIEDYILLFSTREYKKQRVKYFW